jgi:uncharacterized OsmC-like protein
MNGVDTKALFATINAVRDEPTLAQFRFRATNQWLTGNHSRTRIGGFSGAGGEHRHSRDFQYEADHHPVLCGQGHAPAPIEFLLHALAACVTAGIANVAAARGVIVESVEAEVEGDINLLGLLGLSDRIRNGYQNIKIDFRIKGNAPEHVLREIVEQSRARSAVFDVLRHGVPIDFGISAS